MSDTVTSSLRRKWLKFIATKGQYEKAVKISTDVHLHEYYDLQFREVAADPVIYRNGKAIVNGYYRLRTDRAYYPICGKYGIPDDRLSSLARHFDEHRHKGMESGKRKMWSRKMAEEEKHNRLKAAENYRYARNISRCDLAARIGIPISMASDEMLEAKRNQIATFRAIKRIKKITNENNNDENE